MFTLEGPAADRYVAILQEQSGVPLTLSARPVEVDQTLPDRRRGRLVEVAPSALPDNPYCSRTLRDLIREAVRPDGPHVHVQALQDAPNVFIDLFDRVVGRPERIVSVADLEVLARSAAPELAPAMIAHALAEYLYAAGSRLLMTQYANAHVAGLISEARVIRDLTGQAIFEGGSRPWERSVENPGGGVTFLRHYGPGNTYSIITSPGPTFRIRRAARVVSRPAP